MMWKSFSITRLTNGDRVRVELKTEVRTIQFDIDKSRVREFLTLDVAGIEAIVREKEQGE